MAKRKFPLSSILSFSVAGALSYIGDDDSRMKLQQGVLLGIKEVFGLGIFCT
nr:hypothetical protein Itr_chr12CG17850 [Ipomoea trifida]GMD63629.1 hypothetical protein Iba_chr12bCG16710 [Ipomoea batatas]